MRWLKKKKAEEDDPLVAWFVPALLSLLINQEKEKGSPLTKEEVEKITSDGVCVALPLSKVRKLVEERGYGDINPDRAYEHWQEIRGDFVDFDAD